MQAIVHARAENSTFNMKSKKFEFWNINTCVCQAFSMASSILHVNAIPWKAAYGPKVKECVCLKRRKTMGETNRLEFEFVPEVINPVYQRCAVKRQIEKSRQYIRMVINLYPSKKY